MRSGRLDYRLYLVTDDALSRAPVESVVERAIAGGATIVQLRVKAADSRMLYERAVRLRERLAPLNVPLIVNDRLDAALAARADGVHLGQGDLPCAEARRIAGPEFVIGVSVGSPAEAERAERDGATYLAASPVYATPTKTDAPPPVGLSGLAALRNASRLPLVAIGGLHAGNAAEVIRAGADGVAVVSAIMAAEDPAAAARALRAVVDRALAERGRQRAADSRASC